jgi:DNA-binding response OmpR family regulator
MMTRILLLEPDRLLGRTYQQALQQAGYETDWRQTAQSAIHTLDRQPTDLVILELQLAKHNGVEFMYELRSYADWREIPIIILSKVGPSIMDNQVLRQQIGIARYLHKPATKLSDLLTAVNRVLQSA